MKRFFTLFAVLLLCSTALLGLHAQAAVPDYRFGVVEAHDAPWAAAELGAGWTRVTFNWNEVQAEGPDTWNMPISDEQLALELAQGRQVVGLVTNCAGWAADTARGQGVPQGLDLDHDHPYNLWANFLRELASRYAGRIDHWIIWNEPDIWESHYQSWGGTVEDFVQLLRVSYYTIKEVNPNGVVHMAAVTHWWDANYGRDLFFRRFLQVLSRDPNAAANDYYFDVATLHIYFQPESLYDLTVFYRDMMREYGLDKPIWIAETNAAPSDDPAWPVPNPQFKVTLEDQAAFMIQALALGIAGGAERIAVYKTTDTEKDAVANPEPFGLVRLDGTRRPAFTTYRIATTYLAGFRYASWERRDTASVVVVNRGQQTTTVAWSRTPSPVSVLVPAQTTRGLLVDMWGGARVVYPERGYYTLNLAGCSYETVCLVGGAPLMLVEDASENPDVPPPPPPPTVSAAASSPLPTPTPAPTYTPTPAPTATLSPSPSPTISPTAFPTAVPSPASPTPAPARPASAPGLPLVPLLVLAGGLALAGLSTRRR